MHDGKCGHQGHILKLTECRVLKRTRNAVVRRLINNCSNLTAEVGKRNPVYAFKNKFTAAQIHYSLEYPWNGSVAKTLLFCPGSHLHSTLLMFPYRSITGHYSSIRFHHSSTPSLLFLFFFNIGDSSSLDDLAFTWRMNLQSAEACQVEMSHLPTD